MSAGWRTARLAACGLALACAAPPSTFEVERAEALHAAGEARRAFRYSERAIQRNHAHADPRQIALHGEVLRALGREAEAEAFADFAARHAAGEDTYTGETDPSWRECTGDQDGAELVLAWGDRPIRTDYDVGTLAATFEIDAEGRVGGIRVLRARHPAAAWLIIDAISEARISPSRLARRRERQPAGFPVPLCAWWTRERSESGIPAGGCIRGFCTHAPGTPPHM